MIPSKGASSKYYWWGLVRVMVLGFVTSYGRPGFSEESVATTGSQDSGAYQSLLDKGSIAQRGDFTSHLADGRLYLELPTQVLGRDIIVVGRVAKAPPGFGQP